MDFPKPMDAWINPVQYWTDVTLMQMEMTRMGWEIACTVNPFLPEGLLAAEVAVERGVPSARRSHAEGLPKAAPRKSAARPVVQKAPGKTSKPAAKPQPAARPAQTTRARGKAPAAKPAVAVAQHSSKPAPTGAAAKPAAPKRSGAKKPVTLPPDLPPAKDRPDT